LPEGVTWRLGREMEERKVRWKIGGRLWASYFANETRSGYWETRCVEWNQEVELALAAGMMLSSSMDEHHETKLGADD
jgi:hypothetical protein